MSTGRYLGFDGAVVTSFPPRPAAAGFGFMLCPLPILPLGGVAPRAAYDIYRLAYERARAAALPSWYERLNGACRN